jgi:3-phosphoshikimate 1-carboxyvinyltransferase
VRNEFDQINVLDPSDKHAAFALSHGIADARVEEVPDTTTAVLLACPSNRIGGWVIALADHAATVFDAGSVKGSIIHEVKEAVGRLPGNYVPTHPIAGLEQSGPEAADAALFRDRVVIATPGETTDAGRLGEVIGLWRATGARVLEMDPLEHDRIYARTSHLPHLLAFAYLAGIPNEDLTHTGGGFRDFSRIGGSDPEMWSGIFEMNRSSLLEALDTFQTDLAELRRTIEVGDLERCRELIAEARTRRESQEEDPEE